MNPMIEYFNPMSQLYMAKVDVPTRLAIMEWIKTKGFNIMHACAIVAPHYINFLHSGHSDWDKYCLAKGIYGKFERWNTRYSRMFCLCMGEQFMDPLVFSIKPNHNEYFKYE